MCWENCWANLYGILSIITHLAFQSEARGQALHLGISSLMCCNSSVTQSSPHAHCRKHMYMELGVRRGAESLAQRSVLLLCPETKGLLCDGEGGVSIIGPSKVVGILPSKIKSHPYSSWCRFCHSPGECSRLYQRSSFSCTCFSHSPWMKKKLLNKFSLFNSCAFYFWYDS